MAAMLKGDPDAIAIIKASARELWSSWFPNGQ
jgi:hypothetical protein